MHEKKRKKDCSYFLNFVVVRIHVSWRLRQRFVCADPSTRSFATAHQRCAHEIVIPFVIWPSARLPWAVWLETVPDRSLKRSFCHPSWQRWSFSSSLLHSSRSSLSSWLLFLANRRTQMPVPNESAPECRCHTICGPISSVVAGIWRRRVSTVPSWSGACWNCWCHWRERSWWRARQPSRQWTRCRWPSLWATCRG